MEADFWIVIIAVPFGFCITYLCVVMVRLFLMKTVPTGNGHDDENPETEVGKFK